MARFGRRQVAVAAAVLCLIALGVAPVAADTGGGGGGPFVITINPTGTVDRLGVATISGTITCDAATGTVSLLDFFVNVTQPVGRLHSVQGGSQDLTTLTCTPFTPTPWSATIIPSGKFVVGSAFASAFGDACGSFTCGSTQVTAAVKLTH
jgi:hypothetical protein